MEPSSNFGVCQERMLATRKIIRGGAPELIYLLCGRLSIYHLSAGTSFLNPC